MYHLKYRPTTLKEVFGNRGAVNTLSKLSLSNIHAYLISGPSGTGKTTLARIIASELKTHPSEIYEINAANTRGIDTMREIVNTGVWKPISGKTKTFIIDEFAAATNDAQQCLLKPVEEPPSHVYFIFCTTSPEKIIPTIQNRCQKLYTQKLLDRDMILLLESIIEKENLTIPDDILGLILDVADGVPRTSLILLNVLKDVKDINEASDMVYKEVYDTTNLVELCKALIGRKSWGEIIRIYKGMKDIEPEKVRISIFGYLGGYLRNSKDLVEQLFYTDLMTNFVTPLSYVSASTELLFRLSNALLIVRGKEIV